MSCGVGTGLGIVVYAFRNPSAGLCRSTCRVVLNCFLVYYDRRFSSIPFPVQSALVFMSLNK